MKKALPFALLLAAGLGLAACDKKEESSAPATPPATEQPAEPAPAPTTPPASEPAPAAPSTAPAPAEGEQQSQ
ncbi:hypothetical protein [Pseudomonas schmalbachii]|uniref:Lipoprotein n=1 Tax=Pseudomonas schmalbachii TaxID=2816993 RepID=A0ABS3TKS1_9PSED|nr:hypothetical protein [Pseudomonas schmalbachii]MBO3274237.1 hypothetical protein [Pseudomonas schmalbachii]